MREEVVKRGCQAVDCVEKIKTIIIIIIINA